MTAPRVVAIGGGHGLARALSALRRLEAEPTAIVTVADDGGSSGRLRRELDIIAPGDLRMALLALARRTDLADALSHRFERGALAGHALGNLLLVALAEQRGGDFEAAVETAAGLLDCAGRVLPATVEPVQLKATVAGQVRDGQVSVQSGTGRVEMVWLEPSRPRPAGSAVAALREADVVVLGPGSLFTSITAALLVPDLAAALVTSSARVVLVANLATQAQETDGLDLGAHVAGLLAHVPGLRLDVVVAHDGPVPEGPGTPLGTALTDPRVARVVTADLALRRADGVPVAAHDAGRLAEALRPLLRAPVDLPSAS